MSNIKSIVQDIKIALRSKAPSRAQEESDREKKILNPTDPKFVSYGLKISQIETIIRNFLKKYDLTYEEAYQGFNLLIGTHIHDEKMAAISFINRFKRYFDDNIIDLYYKALKNHCDTWAFCDSSMIKVIGPYLAKKENTDLARKTIQKWAASDHLWVKRASLVVFLKIAMIHKDFDETFLFNLVEAIVSDPENYIQKAIGWTLKTCSKYKSKAIYNYLIKNRTLFPRETLRTASEKLSDDLKEKILKK